MQKVGGSALKDEYYKAIKKHKIFLVIPHRQHISGQHTEKKIMGTICVVVAFVPCVCVRI